MKSYVLGVLACLVASTPVSAKQCHRIDPETGYLLVATSSAESATPEWLASVARSAAYRWTVPSRRRSLYVGWESVQRRILPPEPRWADDWAPQAKHQATVHLTVSRDGRSHQIALASGSGDRMFDQSLMSIVNGPMPASPELPKLPDGEAADSVLVILTFGLPAPGTSHGSVRFAAEQTPGRLQPNSLRVDPPTGHPGPFPRTTVKYDIMESGTVNASSIEFLHSQGRNFEEAVRHGLLRARFTAPTSNCRPVGQTVVQTFGN